ncbi:hypothetical protein [Sphingomonas sp. Leaf4]|uniref:hypothetical protein n=1 Tax=Sphingomonas sp. Leaf4 TaxID=2876553 RepID=UPI001E57CFBB|nr:hypothetical protein [Sphingomonas sp. Leaf4]
MPTFTEARDFGLSVIVVVAKATAFRSNPFEAKIREEAGGLADGIVLTRGIAGHTPPDLNRLSKHDSEAAHRVNGGPDRCRQGPAT